MGSSPFIGTNSTQSIPELQRHRNIKNVSKSSKKVQVRGSDPGLPEVFLELLMGNPLIKAR